MMGWYDDRIGWGGWIAMTLMMIAFWGLVIFAMAALFRSTTTTVGAAESAATRDPMRTLDERFARGEIDAEDYYARRAILCHTPHDAAR